MKIEHMNQLILIDNNNNDFFPSEIENCKIKLIYNTNGKWNRIFRKILFSIHFPITHFFYTDWKRDADEADIIILFDTGNAKYILSYLKKHFPKATIILWYWNSVSNSVNPQKIAKKDIETWSFDPADCQKYKMFYNNQFFIMENKPVLNFTKYNRDVFYIGVDKNRGKLLSDLKKIFDEQNISYFFNLVQYKNASNKSEIPYQPSLNYKEVLNYISGSKAIIDLVVEEQTGLTLRPVEALFLRKKLITNMQNIIHYDLYNPQNIFILGYDSIGDLRNFIDSEYDASNNEQLQKKYSFQGWLSHFHKQI